MRACVVPIGTPAYTALTEAISAAFDGAEVLPTREGGSGPEAGLQPALGAPMVFLGVGLPDDQIHAPNEKVTLSMLFRGRRGRRLAVGWVRPRRSHRTRRVTIQPDRRPRRQGAHRFRLVWRACRVPR